METEIEILWILMGGVYENTDELKARFAEMQADGASPADIGEMIKNVAKLSSWLGRLAWLWPW